MAHPSEVNSNGAAGPAPPPSAAELELERIRKRDSDRNKRWREGRQTPAVQVEGPTGAAPSPGRVGAAPPIHSTRPLTELGEGPELYQRAAPPPVANAAPLEPPDTEGAKKFAALVALVFKLALDDATERYELSRMLAELGAGASELDADQVIGAKGAAVGFVFAHAERCALKHGIGISVPYEDELVTLGAGAGSILYLVAKFSGRLDRKEDSSPARPPRAVGAPSFSRAPPPTAPDVDDEPDSGYGPIRVGEARDADGYRS